MSDTCEPFDPPLVFKVKSRKGNQPYHVDLGEWNGQGMCDCGHFLMKLQPKIREGQRGRHLMCYHIKEARDFLADKVVQKFIENEQAQKMLNVEF